MKSLHQTKQKALASKKHASCLIVPKLVIKSKKLNTVQANRSLQTAGEASEYS